MRSRSRLVFLFIISVLISCSGKKNSSSLSSEEQLESEALTTFSKPKESKIYNSKFAFDNLYGRWVSQDTAQLREFKLDQNWFQLIRSDSIDFGKDLSEVNLVYTIDRDMLSIYFKDRKEQGLIKKAIGDSLIIYWVSGEYVTYCKN